MDKRNVGRFGANVGHLGIGHVKIVEISQGRDMVIFDHISKTTYPIKPFIPKWWKSVQEKLKT